MWLKKFCVVIYVITAVKSNLLNDEIIYSSTTENIENSEPTSYERLTYTPKESILEKRLTYTPEDSIVETTAAEDCDGEKGKCLRKCCSKGYAYDTRTKSCVTYREVEDDLTPSNLMINDDNFLFSPDVWNDYDQVDGTIDDFNLFIRDLKCNATVSTRIRLKKYNYQFQFRKDGKLYIKLPTDLTSIWSPKSRDEYCIDTFLVEDTNKSVSVSIDALVCFNKELPDVSYVVKSTLLLISCVFIIATLGIYAWLPELRNLHGKVLMAYLSCLFCGFLLFAGLFLTLYLRIIDADSCRIISIMSYFFLLAAFYWLNIMCFDIWWTFSGRRGLSLERLSLRGRFLVYSLYAFGIPLALTLLVAVLEFSDLPAHPYLPLLKRQGCFFYGLSKTIYFYTPIFIVCVADLVFCVLTVLMIRKIRKETSVLKSNESATHQQKKDTKRLELYIKLFVIMGINWILEVFSGLFPGKFWIVADVYNMLTGLIIFIIFVCKKKIIKLIKRRLDHSQEYSVSRSQTTSSEKYSNRNDNIKMSGDLRVKKQ